jgi:ribosomal protein S18 acetylase RimI-like enzyme
LSQTIIRPARLGDAEALHCHCYPDATLETVQDYLAWCLRQARKGRIVRLVADVEGQAVGNVQITAWGSVAEISSLVVGESFRRRGLARLLLTTAIQEARQCGLLVAEITVRSDETELAAFYRSLGFQPELDNKKKLSHPRSPVPGLRLRMQL